MLAYLNDINLAPILMDFPEISINVTNKCGETPLTVAKEYKNEDILPIFDEEFKFS